MICAPADGKREGGNVPSLPFSLSGGYGYTKANTRLGERASANVTPCYYNQVTKNHIKISFLNSAHLTIDRKNKLSILFRYEVGIATFEIC